MLLRIGMDILPRSPAHFGKIIADETEKWAKVISAANIKADRRRLWPGWSHQRRANCVPRLLIRMRMIPVKCRTGSLGSGHCFAPEGSCMIN
jgi:hypothetical protein